MNILKASSVVVVLAFIAYQYDVFQNGYQYIITQTYFDHHNSITSFTLASINLTEAEENFDKVAKELVTAFQTVGFAYLIDVKSFDPDELLHWTRWFFDLPMKAKMKLAKKAFNANKVNQFRGYFPLIPGGHSYKEAYEMGLFDRDVIDRNFPTPSQIINQTKTKDNRFYMRNICEENNIWPITENNENDLKFIDIMRKYRAFYVQTSEKVMQLIAVGLGLDKNALEHLYGPRSLATFRLIHYPTRLENPSSIPAEAWDGDIPIVTGEHFDSGMLTVLATFNNEGLQIKPKGYSDWVNVPAVKDKFVVNIGALLMQISDEKLVATNHRVLDIGTNRYSVAWFQDPSFDGDISKTLLGNENVFAGKFKKFGPWMTNRTSMYAEYKTTDFGVVD